MPKKKIKRKKAGKFKTKGLIGLSKGMRQKILGEKTVKNKYSETFKNRIIVFFKAKSQTFPEVRSGVF